MSTNLPLSKFKADRVLKSTEITTTIETDMEKVDLFNQQTSNTENICGNIILEFLKLNCKCPGCKSEVDVEDAIATCNNINVVTVESYCVKGDKMKCVVYNKNNNVRINLVVPLQLLQYVSKRS